MTDKQPEALRYAEILENSTNYYPESSSMPDLRLADTVGESASLLRTQHAEIERLTAAIKWEQNRAERIGTHGPGCHLWGPAHHECLLREYANQRGEFASQIERLNAAATDSNLILERAQATNLEMLAAIERKDALLRRAAVHLSRLAMAAGAPTPPGVNVGWVAHYAEQAEKELRKELSQ